MNPNKNLNLSIKIDGIDKAVTNTDLLTNNIDELKGLFSNLNGSMKSISDSFKDFAKVNSEVKDELKKVTNNTKEASGGFSELFEHFKQSKIRSTIKTASNELLQYTAGAILAGKTASESIGEVSSSISSTLFATGNLYATIGGAALMLVTPLVQSIFELSNAEKERQEALKRTIEITKQVGQSSKSAYATATKEIVTNISALDKLRAVESKNIKSIKNRTEVTKELAKQISVATGYTEAEVLALSKTEEGYNRLTEAIKRNAMIRAQIGQLQTSIESTAEVEAEYTRAQIRFAELEARLAPLLQEYTTSTNALQNFRGGNKNGLLRLQTRFDRAKEAVESNPNYKEYIAASQALETARKATLDNSKYVASIISSTTSTDNLSSTNKALIDAINRLELSLPNANISVSSESSPSQVALYGSVDEIAKLLTDTEWLAKQSNTTIIKLQNILDERLSEESKNYETGKNLNDKRLALEKERNELMAQSNKIELLSLQSTESNSRNLAQRPLDFLLNNRIDNEVWASSIRPIIAKYLDGSANPNKLIEELNSNSGMTGLSTFSLRDQALLLEWQKAYNITKKEVELRNNITRLDLEISRLEEKSKANDKYNIAKERQSLVNDAKVSSSNFIKNNLNEFIDTLKNTADIDRDEVEVVADNFKAKIREDLLNTYADAYDKIKEFNERTGIDYFQIDEFGGVIEDSTLLNQIGSDDSEALGLAKQLSDKINNGVNYAMETYLEDLYEQFNEMAERAGIKLDKKNFLSIARLKMTVEDLSIEYERFSQDLADDTQTVIGLFRNNKLTYKEASQSLVENADAQKQFYLNMRDQMKDSDDEIRKRINALKSLYGGIFTETMSEEELERLATSSTSENRARASSILINRGELRNLNNRFDSETNTGVRGINTEAENGIKSLNDILKEKISKALDFIRTNFTDPLMALGSEAMNLMDVLAQNTIDRISEAISEIETQLSETSSKLSQLEGELSQVTSGRRDATIAQIEREEQRERELAAEKIKLEKQLELEERKQFNRRKAWAISEALINGALAITAIAARNPPPSALFFIGAGLSAATTAMQVATISAQRFKRGGYTEAVGNTDYTGSRVAGVVHENEYVVPEYLLKNPEISSIVGTIERMRLSGKADLKGLSQSLSGKNNTNDLQIKQLYDTINKVASRPSIVDVRDINNSQYNLQVKVRDNSL